MTSKATRRINVIAALAILIHALAAGGIGWAGAQTPDFPRTVIDMTGAPVTIDARPGVIGVISGDPVTEWAFPGTDLEILDPNVIAANSAAVDWQRIGLLIVPEYYTAIYPALIESAAAAGVPIFRTRPVTSRALWRATAERLGAVSGREDTVSYLMLQLDRQQAVIQDIVRDQVPVRVLVLTPEGYTFGQGAWITDLIRAVGGINVAAEAGFADYRQIADSTIRELAPDVILLAPAWDRAAFMQIAAYADLPPVQTGRVIQLPFSPTVAADPGPALWTLAWMLYPRAVWDGFWGNRWSW